MAKVAAVETDEPEIAAKPAQAAIVAMPSVHNPLGCTMPVAAKQRLAALVNQFRIPLIEDAVYAELQYQEPLAPLLKSFDDEGWVMVCSSFSKTLAPDYRIGWLDGGRFAADIQLLKFQSTGAESRLLGEAVAADRVALAHQQQVDG